MTSVVFFLNYFQMNL